MARGSLAVSSLLALSALQQAAAALASSPSSGAKHAQCAAPAGGGCFTNDKAKGARLLTTTTVATAAECCDLCTATWQCKAFTAAPATPPPGPPPLIPPHCDFTKMESSKHRHRAAPHRPGRKKKKMATGVVGRPA